MTNMLIMITGQLSHPMMLFVLMVSNYTLIHSN